MRDLTGNRTTRGERAGQGALAVNGNFDPLFGGGERGRPSRS